MKKLIPIILITGVILVFFWQFLFKGFLPVPSDTIVGLYYPFRDAYFKTNPNGVPYKNFLVTDPVRQQIPWRKLVTDLEKKVSIPLWNPYNFTGTPLLANSQSAAFYPLNLLFLVLPFSAAWSLLILFQPLLAGVFLYFYLRNLKLAQLPSFLGALSFAFSGFFVAWLEWGTILNVALWLPLMLLCVDKIFGGTKGKNIIWYLILVFSLVSSFFAGHLQTFFYAVILFLVYFLIRWLQNGKNLKTFATFTLVGFCCIIFSLPQLIPTIKFIALSARNLDLPAWQSNPGWFVPWQNLIQFLAPDFFGNPTTLNYYGIWNYGEFIGYVGIPSFIMAFFALFFRKDKKTLFFGCAFFVSLIFALPTFLAKIPFQLNLPFITTAQPTRFLFITDFSLSILAALGFDYFTKLKDKKQVLYILGSILLLFISFWLFVLLSNGRIISLENLTVAKQNLILPTALFILASAVLLGIVIYPHKKTVNILLITLVLITIFDLLRFAWKFEPFTNKDYFFPSTQITSFLQNQKSEFRIMSTDSRIFPPNFSIMYKLQTIEGYDPLYLQRYGELMIALKRGKPDIASPFGFNRIITPHEISSQIINLLGVQYVLSLDKIVNFQFKEVFTDGVIRVYKNNAAFPRAFFVTETSAAGSKQQAINSLFYLSNSLSRTAIVEGVRKDNLFKNNWSLGQVNITKYEENTVVVKTNNTGNGFLVLTDSFYPTWHAKIDGKETRIYLTDYNFRGIIIPKGVHTIEFYDTLF